MKITTFISLVATIVIPLQMATFYYAVETERRLSRLEVQVQYLQTTKGTDHAR